MDYDAWYRVVRDKKGLPLQGDGNTGLISELGRSWKLLGEEGPGCRWQIWVCQVEEGVLGRGGGLNSRRQGGAWWGWEAVAALLWLQQWVRAVRGPGTGAGLASDCVCPGADAAPTCASRQGGDSGRSALLGSSSLPSASCGKERVEFTTLSLSRMYDREAAGPGFRKLRRQAAALWRLGVRA